uniref:Abasic site processing protein HMCES n=2 Tax=Lygus hesperus TaxID=30085 RepID=A0A0A9XNF3_LYGHE
MCGRLCCYCKHSSYPDRLERIFQSGNRQPSWLNSSKFEPSSNLAPTRSLPVMYLDTHESQELHDRKELFIRPMFWGLEFNHTGKKESSKAQLLHNLRIESLLRPHQSSGFFNSLLQSKKCCAIVCDGYYEWNKKRPYFFYNGKHEYDTSIIAPTWKEDDWVEKGPPVLVLAGIYSSIVKEGRGLEETGEDIYSCSVITGSAPSRIKDIHHRAPIILQTEEEIMAWLDPVGETMENALQGLLEIRDNNTLSYYEVKGQVNNSRYQESACHLPLTCFPTSGTLDKWLKKPQIRMVCPDETKIHAEEPPSASSKRKLTSTSSGKFSGSPSKKKSLITNWLYKTS